LNCERLSARRFGLGEPPLLFNVEHLIKRVSLPELEQIECSQNRNYANLHVGGHDVARPRRGRQRKSKRSDTDQQSLRSRIWFPLPKDLKN
jgi:hypothetical protein